MTELRDLKDSVTPYYQRLVDVSELEHEWLLGVRVDFIVRVKSTWARARAEGHLDAQLNLTRLLVEALHCAGRVPEALTVLRAFPGVGHERPFALRVAEAIIVLQVDGGEVTAHTLAALASEALAGS